MQIPLDKYCGDKKMIGLLEKAGSKLSISEMYGLLYGCMAAPHLVMPSKIMPLLFGEEGTALETLEDAEELYGNLMGLWNVIARWKPESEPFFYPDIEYHDTLEGLKQRIQDHSSLIKFFINGLDMGDADTNNFSEDAYKAFEFLSKANAFFLHYSELLNKESFEENKEFRKTVDLVYQLEDVIGDCIASINLGLKEARTRVVEEKHTFTTAHDDTHTKIPRNAPCPCGSGKKYKKCCGLTH